jgi:hypothetical protein
MLQSDMPTGALAGLPNAACSTATSTSRGRGLTVQEAARSLGIPRLAFVALCEHHGLLELRPFEGLQQRRFVTATAEATKIGWNANMMRLRSIRRAHRNAWPFAVFAPQRLPDVAWMLDWPGLVGATVAMDGRGAKLAFLLDQHGYLPDQIIADLSGYSRSAVQKVRGQQGAQEAEQAAGTASVTAGQPAPGT